MSRSRSGPGAEVRAARWLAVHPTWWALPAGAVLLVAKVGARPVALVLVVAAVVLLGWARSAPSSFDRHATVWARSWWRRWFGPYRGPAWRDLMEACDLAVYGRRDNTLKTPQVLAVRSVSPSLDLVTVKLVKGLAPKALTDRAAELADGLKSERVTVSPVKPQRVKVLVQRRNPFEPDPIPAVDIPLAPGDVDLRRIEIGDDEYGRPFTINLAGQHLLCSGATGSGKGSVLWSVLRQLGPWIADGTAKLWVIDLKGGLETDRGRPLFHRWATTFEDAVALVNDFHDDMTRAQAAARLSGKRSTTPCPDSPLQLLLIDEKAMLTALGDATTVRKTVKVMSAVQTQGRATGHGVIGFLQEPTKDVLPTRDLYTVRLCLASTTALHVDMVLGDGARDRGALADEIPIGGEFAGHGYAILPRTRTPIRFRAAEATDADIDDLVAACTPVRAEATPPAGIPVAGDNGDLVDDDTATTAVLALDDTGDDFDPAAFTTLDPAPVAGRGKRGRR